MANAICSNLPTINGISEADLYKNLKFSDPVCDVTKFGCSPSNPRHKICEYCIVRYVLLLTGHDRLARLSFLCFGVLPVKCREMFILKFLLTFRLAIDARLHQKTELMVENRP